MPDSVDEIRKLSPEERIRRLKELEDERRKEIEAAEGLIKETVRELEEAEEKKKIPIPEARATDLSMIETVEGKQIVATHHFLDLKKPEDGVSHQGKKKSLEEVAIEENVATGQPQREGGRGYSTQGAAFADYVSSSKQAVTNSGAASPIEDKITDFYRERATSEAGVGEDSQQKYISRQQETAGYETRKREEEDRKEFYKRRGGPA